MRRGRKRLPPPPRPPVAARPKPELDPVTRKHVHETRRKGAHKGWATRRANQANSPDWLEAAAARAEARLKRRARARDPDFPSPHLPHVTKPSFSPCKWDRSAAARNGWRRRYARMREARRTYKKDV